MGTELHDRLISLETPPCCIGSIFCEEPGDLVAEGSIHGSEELMRKVKKAKRAILEPDAGPSLGLKCEGDRNGIRWVKALRT